MRFLTPLAVTMVALWLATASQGVALGMLMGEAGKATIVHTGSLEFRVTNMLDEASHFVVYAENKDGTELTPDVEFRTDKVVYNVKSKAFAVPEIRFKPGDERRSIRVCIKNTDEQGNVAKSGYIIRMCSRAVVYMGR